MYATPPRFVGMFTPSSCNRMKLSDLRLVCANCHRMVHRAQPWLATTAVSEMVTGQRPLPDSREDGFTVN